MNPLRVLADWFTPPDRPECDQLHIAFRNDTALITSKQPLSYTEREQLMRHNGQPECPIPEHADALRLYGRAVWDRDRALDALEMVVTSRNAWRERALRAESRLDHPANPRNQAAGLQTIRDPYQGQIPGRAA